MSTTTPSATPAALANAAAAVTHRRIALVAGVMYLVTIVASVPAQYFIYAPVLTNDVAPVGGP